MSNRLKYTIIIMLVVGFISPVFSIFIGHWSAEQSVRRADAAKAEAAKQSHDLVCYLFAAILDAYNETPPPSTTGKNVRDAWAHLYDLAQCQPPRKE